MSKTLSGALSGLFSLAGAVLLVACGGTSSDSSDRLRSGLSGEDGQESDTATKDGEHSGEATGGDVKEPPTEPAPEGSACTMHTLGGGDACHTNGDWKVEASSLCQSEGLVVASVSFGEACGETDGSSTGAKVECCHPATEEPKDPPSEPACFEKDLFSGDGACSTADALEAAAKEKCAGAGLTLGNVVVGDACEGGGVKGIHFTCCN